MWAIPDFNVGLVPNVGIIVGTKATLVVDTGLGPRNGEAIVREMKKVSRNADVYVVTTHYHPEHSLGAGAFTGAKLVMTRVQQQEMSEVGKAIQDTFASRSPAQQGALERRTVSHAGHPVRSRASPRPWRRARAAVMARTGGDAYARRHDGVRRGGSCAVHRRRGDEPAISRGAEHIEPRDVDLGARRTDCFEASHVVPSHGKLGDATLIARDRAFIQAVRERVGALKREGKSIDDAVAAVVAEIAPQYPEFGNPANAGAMARAAFAEAR